MKPSHVAQLVGRMIAAYPRQQVSPATGDLYGSMLVDLEYAEARRALDEHIAESPHFPTVADIRQRVARRAARCPGVDEAWSEVIRVVQRHGSHYAGGFSHPAIGAAVEGVGGLLAIGRSENVATERAHFIRMYEVACTRVVRSENVERLELASGNGVGKLTDGGR